MVGGLRDGTGAMMFESLRLGVGAFRCGEYSWGAFSCGAFNCGAFN